MKLQKGNERWCFTRFSIGFAGGLMLAVPAGAFLFGTNTCTGFWWALGVSALIGFIASRKT